MMNCKLYGVGLSDHTVVSDNAAAAELFCRRAEERFGVKLGIVSATDSVGGAAVRIGSFGCDGRGGYRFCVGSRDGDIFVDGETEELQLAAVDFLFDRFFNGEGTEVTIPEKVYGNYWFDGAANTGTVFSEKAVERELAPGVTYYELKYSNSEGRNVDVFAMVVEGSSKAKFRVWAGDMASIYDGKLQMRLQTVAGQAAELENELGEEVVGAVNAGYFYMNTNHYPYSMRIIQGKELSPPNGRGLYGWPDDWMGLTSDGEFVHGSKASYYSDWKVGGSIEWAVGTGVHMMLDGIIQYEKKRLVPLNPLTAIATTSDGGFILLCADGRTAKSAGATSADILGMMLDIEGFRPDLKLVDAFTLDGGGSTEMVLKDNEKNEFFTVNYPSDGKHREVGDIIAVAIPKK